MTISFNPTYSRAGVQSPDDYAKTYAAQKGISVDEAKEELKSRYGDPSAQAPLFNFNDVESSYVEFENDTDNFNDTGNNANAVSGFLKGAFQKLLDLLKGGSGPRNEGDPQSHLNPETNEITGPLKEGDFNPFDMQEDPDTVAAKYAEANGITIEEAKAKLEEMYGKPVEK